MQTFYKGCATTMLLCVVLFMSFLVSTIIGDSVARSMGFYEEGIQDSNPLRMGQ